MPLPRLRQVALVARDLDSAASAVRRDLGAGEPYADPGIIEFGLANAVFAIGDTFLEVVSPVRDATTAGRLLDKRGDGGYMAIFQLPDGDALATARARAAELGIRIVWQADLADISGTHLHPKDVPGAIVSLDAADPPATWHWAGPAWTGATPDRVSPGGIVDVTVRTPDAGAAARRWSDVLGVAADGRTIELAGGQSVRFEDGSDDGIVAVTVALPATVRAGRDVTDVCGVRFALIDAKEQA